MRFTAFRPVCALVCMVIFSLTSVVSSAGDKPLYEDGNVIIKFRGDAPEYEAWKAAGRTGEITELRALLGAHTSEGYLSDGTLTLLTKRYNEQMRLLSGENPGVSMARIAVIHASAARNLSVLVKKASALPFIEYAELMPARYLCLTPNDSLFADVGQYYIKNTKANDAWDQLPGTEKVVISVVDTGVDYLHADLKDVMFTNAGEVGTDANGKDKKTNKVDDDNNGFIDDWRGWDFAGATTGSPQDNDPMPGYMHGTHCAGIVGASVNNRVGIAGMCHRASIMAVKIGTNNAALVRSYEGIAYSAGMGAPIISCSWGGGAASQAEQEVVTAANKLGSLVIVAAGNDGVSDLFYPAAYKNVLAVSAVGRNDAKANFSNYGAHVGIAAPGVFILSTIPGNGYDHSDGTSMATPCVAGAAGLVKLKYPSYTPDQMSALLRATADNVDAKTGNRNTAWMNLIGSGRVNALRAVTAVTARFAQVIDVEVKDADGDGAYDLGNTITITPRIQNVLSQLNNVSVKVALTTPGTGITLNQTSAVLGVMGSADIKAPSQAYSFVVPATTKENSSVSFSVTIYEDTLIVGRGSFSMNLRPTYRTLRNNNITVTVNSVGNLGYNDYSGNFQGEGLRYKDSHSLMFECGLMVGSSPTALSNVVRGNPASKQDSSFRLVTPAALLIPGTLAATECTTAFSDKTGVNAAGVDVEQTVRQYAEKGREDFVISVYDIKNPGAATINNLYCGLYTDWDISASGQKDEAMYVDSLGFFYARSTVDPGMPWVGMQVLTKQKENVFLMDNDGTAQDNPGVYDNFTADEKFQTLSSGLGRTSTQVTDVSTVISAGPFAVEAGKTEQVAFSIFCGMNLQQLGTAAKAARDAFNNIVSVENGDEAARAVMVMPNPSTSGQGTVRIRVDRETDLSCDVVDALGRHIGNLAKNQHVTPGEYIFALNSSPTRTGTEELSRGSYFIRVHTHYGMFVEPFVVLP